MARTVAFLFAWLLPIFGFGATTSYYVDSGRTSNGDGSQANPWKQITDINWTTVSNSVNTGPVNVYFSSRATWAISGVLDPTVRNGTNWLSLIGDEQYNTNATGTAIWYSETTTNVANITQSSGFGGQMGFDNNTTFAAIKGFSCPNVKDNGFASLSSFPTTNVHDIKLLNIYYGCNPANLSGHGIFLGFCETNCYSIQVSNVTVKNSFSEAIYLGHYNYLYDSMTNCIVEHCTVIDCGGDATHEGDIDIKPPVYGCIIRHNIHTNSAGFVGNDCGVVVGADNCQIYGNTFHNSWNVADGGWGSGIFVNSEGDATTGKAITACLIYNNLIYYCQGHGIALTATKTIPASPAPNISGVKIWNNTIIGCNDGVQITACNGRTVTVDQFENNLIGLCTNFNFTAGSVGCTAATLTACDYNLYYPGAVTVQNLVAAGVNKTWAQWQALGYDAHGVTNDPTLNADYSLSSTSPARSVGSNLSSSFTTDLLGKTRTSWDLGAFASDSLITSNLILYPTFECLSVVAPFSGDANSNTTAVVQFKKTSDSTWLNAYAPFIDRRTSILFNTAFDNSYNLNQARVSIVGLVANTSYDVRVLWSDADGGSANVTNTVSTLSYTIPNSGSDIWVDASAGSEGDGSSGNPYKTITNAVKNAAAGNKIRIKTGTYVPFTMATNGAAGNYLRLVGEPGATVVIDGTGVNQNLTCGSSLGWVSFENLTFNQSEHLTTTLSANQHHLWFVGCNFTNLSRLASPGNDAGIFVQGPAVSNLFILNCAFSSTNTTDQLEGVWLNLVGKTVVLSSNIFTTGFRDNISGSGSGRDITNFGNVDICHNFMSGNQDDGMELDGSGNNMRVWDNTITCTNGASCISIAPVMVGPAYVFRNRLSISTAAFPVFKVGNFSSGPVFVFHNTCLANNNSHDVISDVAGPPYSDYITYYNNILEASRYTIYRGGRSNLYDYNIHLDPNSFVIDEWQTNLSTHYASLAAFKAANPTQEVHGFTNDPVVVNWQIGSTSPAKDAGVIISNFNDASSAWPYSGTAPDIGQFEFTPPAPPSFWAGSIRAGRVSKP